MRVVERLGRTRFILLCVGAALVALLVWRWHSASEKAAADAAKAGQKTVAVEVAAAKQTDVPIDLEGLGTVQAFYTVTVTARVDGQLEKIGFVEGQAVKKGDLLAQIDPRLYQAALEQAQATRLKDVAQLTNAQRDLDRYTILAPQDLASKQTVDTQRAAVDQLNAQIKGDQASIDNAKTQLDYTRITSPIDGRTGIRLIDPGNNVHSADTTGIVVVTQVQPISVVFTLPEEALSAVNSALAAGSVKVTALARDAQTELDTGTLALVDNQIDQTTGTARLKAIFPNTHNALWPGQFINARVLVKVERNAVTIPTAAVQRGADGFFTYVVNEGTNGLSAKSSDEAAAGSSDKSSDGSAAVGNKGNATVEMRALKVGVERDGLTVVTSGLRPGEQVVISNQYRLEPGAKVQAHGAAGEAPVNKGYASINATGVPSSPRSGTTPSASDKLGQNTGLRASNSSGEAGS